MTTPTIEYGNREGQYFLLGLFDELTTLATELAEYIPHATGWKIWYDAYHDFHRLEFDVDGHHFAVKRYKVFTLSRDGNESYSGEFPTVNFGRSSWFLLMMFKSGRHKTWTYYGGEPIR